jgi:hypothetical protein
MPLLAHSVGFERFAAVSTLSPAVEEREVATGDGEGTSQGTSMSSINRSKCCAAVLPIVLVSALMNSEAWAHPRLLPDPVSQQRAADLRKKANAMASKGDLEGALVAYKASLELDETCGAIANLGALELQLGKHRDAAEHLSLASQVCERDGQDPNLAKALVDRLEQARAKVGTIKIHVGISNLKVWVDGREVDRLDLGATYVDPGSHAVSATSNGSTVDQKAVTVNAGAVVEVELGPSAPAPTLPRTAFPSSSQPETPTPPPTKSLAVLVTGAALAATGVALGIGFTVAANDKYSQGIAARNALVAQSGPAACGVQGNAVPCASLRGVWQDHDTFTDVAFWSFLAAGAVAAGTVTYAVWPASKEPQTPTTAQVTPLVTPNGGGLVIDGRF